MKIRIRKRLRVIISLLIVFFMISINVITYSEDDVLLTETAQDLLNPAQNSISTFSSFKVGDTIEFGKLNDKPILWRVIDIDALGNPMIFSEKIINLMPFDIGGQHLSMDSEGFRSIMGSHFWQESFIRTWLNTTEDSILVPDFTTTNYFYNSLDTESMLNTIEYPSFFSMFGLTSDEQKMILENTRKTSVSNFDIEYKVGGNGIDLTNNWYLPEIYKNYAFFNYTKNDEKVFLLDAVELYNLVLSKKDILGQDFANASVLEGLENSEFNKDVIIESINKIAGYWLRTPENVRSYDVYSFNTNYTGNHVNYTHGGVRPAMILDKNMLIVTSGNGSNISPYALIPNTSGEKSISNIFKTSDIEIGQYINLGVYNNQRILWRIIDIDAEGSPLIITDKILDILAYDASGNAYANESPASNRMAKGSNFWLNSTIRQWLNSADDKVSWIGNPPSVNNVRDPLIAYSEESGFLSSKHFTEEESKLIKPIVHETPLSYFDGNVSLSSYFNRYYFIDDIKIGALPDNDGYYHRVSDKVFLLSLRNIRESIIKYKDILGLDYFIGKVPNYVAAKMNRSYIQENEYYLNFTRTPMLSFGELVQVLDINPKFMGNMTIAMNEANSYGGIRPSMYLDLKEVKQVFGDGSLENPFQFAPALLNEETNLGLNETNSAESDNINLIINRYFDEKGNDKPSTWALNSVFGAIASDIIPDSLQRNYTNPITRGEFCKIIIQMIEQATQTSIDEYLIAQSITLEPYKFSDTQDLNIRQAFALGLITGYDGKAFPNATLKRSEAAVILMNVCKLLEIIPDLTQHRVFTDTSKMPEWCKEAVEFVTAPLDNGNSFMNGTGDSFNYSGIYTREQAIVTIYKVFRSF